MPEPTKFHLSIWSGPTKVEYYANVLRKNIGFDICEGVEHVHAKFFAENLTALENTLKSAFGHNVTYRNAKGGPYTTTV